MKDDIMQRLTVVLSALNNTSVSGKANLANLSGSIAVLEEICGMLSEAVITTNDAPAEEA